MKRLHPLAGLLISMAAISACQVCYVAAGANLSSSAAFVSSFALGLAFVIWIEADARRRFGIPCYDFGFLVALFFPMSLLWYAIWSRGWRGLFTLAGLLGLMLLPWLSAIAAWLLLYGIR